MRISPFLWKRLVNIHMPRYQKAYVLFSGGKDSNALLHYTIKRFGKDKVVGVHFNHRLIDWDDECFKFCTDVFEHYDIEYHMYAPLDKLIVPKSHSKESACRESRLDMISQNFKDKLFLAAHHLDDAVESYLMKCLSGNADYIPIPWETQIGTNLIFRPLLLTPIESVIKYNDEKDLDKFVLTDPLNKDSRRGWIRSVLWPCIQEKYPGLATVVRKKYLKSFGDSNGLGKVA